MKCIYLIRIMCILAFAIICSACQSFTSNYEADKEITLRLEPGQGNPRNSEGDFIQLKDGTILFVYTHFIDGSGDNSEAYLAGRYSNDGGKTWSVEDVTILPNEGDMNIMSVSLLRLQSGEVALFYLRKNSEMDCIPFMRISTDEAKTWKKPIRCMTAEGYHVVNNDRFVQLPNGRIIYPTSLHGPPKWSNGTIMCYYSDDNGNSWNKSQEVANPKKIVLQEPGIVPLKGGELMLFCRSDAGVQYISFSYDLGETWSEIEPGNIVSPLSPATIERIPSTGDLLLVWNNNLEMAKDGGKRTPFNLAISKNEGRSWEKIKTIESDPAGWYCYTAMDFTEDHVLLGHCAGNTKVENGLETTQITRLTLDWIYKEATPNPIVIKMEETFALACKDENARIRYTLDGSLPLENNGLIYHRPIVVDKLTPLHMQAFQSGKAPSQIISSKIGSHIFQKAQQVSLELTQGLDYQYYEGEFDHTDQIDIASPLQAGVIPQFITQNSSASENFAFVFEGYIKVVEDGLYTFYLESNDGSALYLNGDELIDNDGAHAVYEQSSSTSLQAGIHKIKVKYFQLGGAHALKVSWEGVNFKKSEIPAGVLFH